MLDAWLLKEGTILKNKKSWLRFEDSHEKTVTYSLTRGEITNRRATTEYFSTG